MAGKAIHEDNIVHYTYLGKYLHLSYILKQNKKQNKPKTKYKIIKTKGFDRGEITRILPVNKEIINNYFNDYSHDYKNNITASIQIGVQTELNETEKAVIGRGGKTIALMNIKRGQGCECGCKDIAIDNDHGETFCPRCGLILDTSISDEFLEAII
ncbi:TFIIB-type zinc ribbon-containing protein [Methanobacterium sp.]|uniref:TFIIB-type zinc ribbon-containing protein n=1 Tax=Methanobacterium sp. TaxID=2164 RepID=UPI00315827A7